MSISFMTLFVFSSITLLILYSLNEYSSVSSSSYSQLYLIKNYKIKIEEEHDGIIILAYIVILFGIIFPNLNQID